VYRWRPHSKLLILNFFGQIIYFFFIICGLREMLHPIYPYANKFKT
jgi:hypothetical protein